MVKHLFINRDKTLLKVENLAVSTGGILGHKSCLPFRQVLILPLSTVSDYGLLPGDLKENIVIDDLDIHVLESGTVITIGGVQIRLTFHCEPCIKVKSRINPNKIQHKRGYLGSFLNTGKIKLGDELLIGKKEFETIPYDIKERIVWFLDKQNVPVSFKQLAYEIGLSPGYYRAIPNLMKKMDIKYRNMVVSHKQT